MSNNSEKLVKDIRRRTLRATQILSSQNLIDLVGKVVDNDNIFLYGNSLGSLTIIELAEVLGNRVRAIAISAGGIMLRSGFVYMTPNGSDGVTDITAPII